MEYHISEENLNMLSAINDALGEIYTKGQDSIMLVKIRTALLTLLNDIQAAAHAADHVHVNIVQQPENDMKEE